MLTLFAELTGETWGYLDGLLIAKEIQLLWRC